MSPDEALDNRLRLDILHRTGVLDSPPEEVFDRLTEVVCRAIAKSSRASKDSRSRGIPRERPRSCIRFAGTSWSSNCRLWSRTRGCTIS
jgi:hypothetical protein